MREKIRGIVNKVPKWGRVLIACTVIIAVFVVADYYVQTYIHRAFCEIVEDDFSHVFQMDSVERKNDKLFLNGWVFELGIDSKENDYDVILYDYNNDNEYYMHVEDEVREDVDELFCCEYDYSKSGFIASISVRNLDIEEDNYEILIRKNDVKNAFKTGVYISKGKILYTKPEDFIALKVEETVLEEVVDKGVLRFYRSDVGMYVYQYKGKLYWIANENYIFEDDNSTYIQYHLNTTQINNLPSHRIENNWFFDDKGFYFEKNEIYESSVDSYRVTISDLPTDYSITKIWTGYYVNSWVWRQDFRPWYEFE